MTAVGVECRILKPDWCSERTLFSVRNETSELNLDYTFHYFGYWRKYKDRAGIIYIILLINK